MIVKVCGMRDPDNIRAVEGLGVDWMGFIFAPSSTRYVGDAVPSYLPKFCKRVGVFVDASEEEICRRAEDFSLNVVQLHGHESPDFCRNISNLLPTVLIVKAFGIETVDDLKKVKPYGRAAAYFLFDSGKGGSGKSFDWSILEKYRGKTPFIIGGGIGPDSVEALRSIHHPMWRGIDLNSRFETLPGVKDVEMLKNFLKETNEQD